MSIPTDADYNIAIQNPSGCFVDPLLRSGQVEVGPLGLPKARTGNFAAVYKITTAGKPWAVRCFTRSIPADQHERYQVIASHLSGARLPYCVPFEYERKGIRVGPEWHPIVKMEWASGESLASYIARHKNSRTKLVELAAAWVEMISRLRMAGIAHGDLQHGNVLVDQAGRLVLVDYDGMFVPALAGRLGQEDGHPNYQHPGRAALHYGPELDNFSAWVILVSILAVAAVPTLWDQFQGGDDCLLFKRADFKDPDRSRIFAALTQLADRRVRFAASCFKTAAYCAPQQVPPLNGQLVEPATMRPLGNSSPTSSALPWWREQVQSRPTPDVKASSIAAEWVLDLLESEAPPVRVTWSQKYDRLALAILALVIGLSVLVGSPGIGLAAEFACGLGFLSLYTRHRYKSTPEATKWAVAVEKLRLVERESSDFKKELRKAEKTVAELELQRDAATESSRARQSDIQTEKLEELQRMQASHSEELRNIAARKLEAERREQSGLRSVDARHGSELNRIKSALSAVQLDMQQELSSLLATIRSRHAEQYLRSIPITAAAIGIPRKVLNDLMHSGVRTAYDANMVRRMKYPGIGPKRYSALLSWRANLESRAQARAPQALPQEVTQGIHAKYATQRSHLESQRIRLQGLYDADCSVFRREADDARQKCTASESQAANRLGAQQDAIEKQFSPRFLALDRELAIATRRLLEQKRSADDALQQAHRRSYELVWKRERAARDVDRLRQGTYGQYLLALTRLV